MTRLIDADALIKKWENVHSKDASFAMAVIGAINDVKKAPTIDAVPVRHGEWIYDDGYYCSECNHHAYGNTLECMNGTYRYCPNCGALMDEVKP